VGALFLLRLRPVFYTLTDSPKDLSHGVPEGYTFLDY